MSAVLSQPQCVKVLCLSCFQFENEEEAAACRLALHGTQWPSSNPKFLHVDFASQDEMEHYTQTGAPPPASLKREVHQDVRQKERERERERRHREREEREAARKEAEKGIREVRMKKDDPEKLRKEHVREWDRDKVRQRSRTPSPHRERDRRRSEGDRDKRRSRSRERVRDRPTSDKNKDKKDKKGGWAVEKWGTHTIGGHVVIQNFPNSIASSLSLG